MPQLDKFIFFSQLFWLLLLLLSLYLLLVGLVLPRLLRTLKVRRVRLGRWSGRLTSVVGSSEPLADFRRSSFSALVSAGERLGVEQLKAVRTPSPSLLLLPPATPLSSSTPPPPPSLLPPKPPVSYPAIFSLYLKIRHPQKASSGPLLHTLSAPLHPATVATPAATPAPEITRRQARLSYLILRRIVNRASSGRPPLLLPLLGLYFERLAQDLLYSLDPLRFIKSYSRAPRFYRFIKMSAPLIQVRQLRALRASERRPLFNKLPSILSRLYEHSTLSACGFSASPPSPLVVE